MGGQRGKANSFFLIDWAAEQSKLLYPYGWGAGEGRYNDFYKDNEKLLIGDDQLGRLPIFENINYRCFFKGLRPLRSPNVKGVPLKNPKSRSKSFKNIVCTLRQT
jgi:hypothetical protein